MSILAWMVHTPLAQALGWTLVHFLWEGALLAVLLMAALRLFRNAPARRRYALACLFLAAMPLAFAATLAILWARQPAPVPFRYPVLLLPAAATVPAVASAPRFSFAGLLDRLPWLVPLWILGVALFYLRAAAGWLSVQRLRRRGVCAPAPAWQARLDELAARLRLSRPVALLESCLTDTPVLVGYLRPVILLPIGCLTGLSTAQVECILLHELAHVVRHDYLVNLLQSLVEGLLFYHPAVWWTSRVVRAERENCCDDCVVEFVGDARSYAATLAALEARRAPQAALAATGGNLMQRIRRLTRETPRTSAAPAASAGLLLVLFAAALAAVPARLPMVRHARPAGVVLAPAPQTQALATPYRKWLDEEAVYIIKNEERQAFLNLTTDEEREKFIEQFWTRRDPTPGTAANEFREEHYRRIAFANDHYGHQNTAGWKSDRGRVYITYGPPDEIDDHSAGDATTVPYQQWRYRYIDGTGRDVIIDFIDRDRTGEFRMSTDPKEKQQGPPAARAALPAADAQSTVFVSRDQPLVSVIVSPGGAPAGVIRPTDVLEISYFARSPEVAAKRADCVALEQHYQSDYPMVRACYDEVKSLEERAQGGTLQIQTLENLRNDQLNIQTRINASKVAVENLRRRETDLAKRLEEAKSNPNPEIAQKYNDLTARLTAAKDKYAIAIQKGADSPEARDAKREMDAAQLTLAALREVSQWKPAEDAAALQSQIAANEDRIAVEQQNQTILESSLGNNRKQQSQLQANAGAAVRQVQSRVTVTEAGTASIDGLGDFAAAGLTPAQLEAAIGPNSSVRLTSSLSRSVTALVQLGSAGSFHVLGEVMTERNRIVSTFEDSVRHQAAIAKTIFIRPGQYRLRVITKNTASGAETNRTVEFSVE